MTDVRVRQLIPPRLGAHAYQSMTDQHGHDVGLISHIVGWGLEKVIDDLLDKLVADE